MSFDSLIAKAVKLELLAAQLQLQASREPEESRGPLEALAADSRKLAGVIGRILKD
jgi:hypothetical protein